MKETWRLRRTFCSNFLERRGYSSGFHRLLQEAPCEFSRKLLVVAAGRPGLPYQNLNNRRLGLALVRRRLAWAGRCAGLMRWAGPVGAEARTGARGSSAGGGVPHQQHLPRPPLIQQCSTPPPPPPPATTPTTTTVARRYRPRPGPGPGRRVPSGGAKCCD